MLKTLVGIQKDYFLTGNPRRRRPLTQRALAVMLDIETSALNRLISNKSIQLPWGLEAPIKALLPSPKSLMRENLAALALANPTLSDNALCFEMVRLYGAKLSRRSIAQYRKESAVGGKWRRIHESPDCSNAAGTNPNYTLAGK